MDVCVVAGAYGRVLVAWARAGGASDEMVRESVIVVGRKIRRASLYVGSVVDDFADCFCLVGCNGVWKGASAWALGVVLG